MGLTIERVPQSLQKNELPQIRFRRHTYEYFTIFALIHDIIGLGWPHLGTPGVLVRGCLTPVHHAPHIEMPSIPLQLKSKTEEVSKGGIRLFMLFQLVQTSTCNSEWHEEVFK